MVGAWGGVWGVLFNPKVVKADELKEKTIIKTKKNVVNVPHWVISRMRFCILSF